MGSTILCQVRDVLIVEWIFRENITEALLVVGSKVFSSMFLSQHMHVGIA